MKSTGKQHPLLHELTKGIVAENPVLRLVLGTCPTLAVTTMAANGIGMGLGFTLAISIIACVRELLGTGCIAGINLLGAGYEPMLISTMAPGGFMIFGLTLGVANIIMKSIEKKKKAKEAA